MLNNRQIQSLHRALLSAFNSQELEELIEVGIGAPLRLLVAPGTDARSQVFEIITAAERAGWTADLVQAAYKARPQNRPLAEIYESLGFATPIQLQTGEKEDFATVSSTDEQLKQVVAGSGSLDLDLWQRRLRSIQSQVCRIELQGSVAGTGFLVGPDAVLTAQHVVADVISGVLPPSSVRVRFDYGQEFGGSVPQGLLVPLHASQWLLDSSPSAHGEFEGRECEVQPNEDQLDHALLRLEHPAGTEQVQGAAPPGIRGWIDLSSAPPLKPGTPLVIVQYSAGQRLSLQIDQRGIAMLNLNRTRVMYPTSTDLGSSGAPCFDTQWQILAMNVAYRIDPALNIGIPAAAIHQRLVRAGLADWVTPPSPEPIDEAEFSKAAVAPPAPAPVVNPDDPQKGRWGGKAEREGLKLTAKLKDVTPGIFIFDAIVESAPGIMLQGPVVFHLHDSFPKSVIWIRRVRDGRRAVLEEVRSYGVFTIGAQVRNTLGEWVGLELDLSGLPDLPKRFLDR